MVVLGAPLTPKISLYPEDVEWDCDCSSPLDACEHVAATLIALRQGTHETSAAQGIEYRLRRTREGLFFERGVSDDARFQIIDVPLDALASGRFHGPSVDATPADLAVETALHGQRHGVLPRRAVARVLRALARVDRVQLDGDPVRISGEAIAPSVVVEDVPGGIRLRLASRGILDESVVLADGVLHPAAEPSLWSRERRDLEEGRVFRADELFELVGAVLPSLKKRLTLDIRTKKLPTAVRARPRMSLVCKRDGDHLYLLPGIVYGNPPTGRVVGERGGRLVALGGDVPIRDLDAERALAERFRYELGLEVGRGEELDTETAIEMTRTLERFDGHIEGDGLAAFRLHPALTAELSAEEGRFDVRFGNADPKTVLRAWRDRASLVPLRDGGFAPLPIDWLEQYGDAVADLLAAKEATGELPRAALPDLARLCDDLGTPPPPGFDALRKVVDDFEGLPEASMAESLRAELRDYQRRGANWLAFLREIGFGALLADDMGLGKTVQALSVLTGRCLVAAPTSVLRNWVDEAARFRADLSVCLFHGPSRELDPNADLTVTSHALLRLDREPLNAVLWDTVIIDEGQAIRNPDTDLARAAYGLEARFRVSLTGTPIENWLVDLWSQLHFLNPGLLGGLSDFEERYVRPLERGEAEPLERLRERIRPFFLRRLKSEVAPELPPRTEITLRAELTDEERKVYEAVRLAARRDVLSALGRKAKVLAALEALLRLRQAACHAALVPGQEASTSSKTELLANTLETAAAEGHKALVFSQWTSMLDLLEPHMRAHGLSYVRLDGSTRDRGAVVDRFQNEDDVSVFLISLKAGGVGLNLTAADHVFLFDPWWNPAVEQQAFDRAHRIGQDKPVFVHRLVASNTVEERILELQNEKRALAEMAAGSQGASLTRDDLLRLIEA